MNVRLVSNVAAASLGLLAGCGCPSTQRIAFQSNRKDGIDQIFTMKADGTDVLQVTDDPVECWQPAISLLRARLAFVRDPSGAAELWTIGPDGSAPEAVVTDMAARGVRWDRASFEFALSASSGGAPDIWVMTADGQNRRQLTDDPGADVEPSFSPDGTRIVFTSTRNGASDIYVMNADGSGETRLTTDAAHDAQGSFSPDGTKIAFWSRRSGDGDIYLMDADGSNVVNVVSHPSLDFEPVFAPDADRIAFSSMRDGNWEIYVLDLATQEITRVTFDPSSDRAADWR